MTASATMPNGPRTQVDAGIETLINSYTFRAIEITDYLSNEGSIEVVQYMAGRTSAKMIGLYDWRSDDTDEI